MTRSGWHREPGRHSLAAQGIKTHCPKKSRCAPKKSAVPGMKIEDLGEYSEGESMLWMENKSWICQLEDERNIHLGLMVETINWPEAVGDEAPDKEYPVGLYGEIYVVPKEMSKKFKSSVASSSGITPDEVSVTDVKGYSGGVPVTTVLEGIEGAKKPDIDSKVIKWKDGRVERYFKNEEDAKKWAREVYAHNASGLFLLIGFTLDRPVNMIGNTGWDIIRHQKKGTEYL